MCVTLRNAMLCCVISGVRQKPMPEAYTSVRVTAETHRRLDLLKGRMLRAAFASARASVPERGLSMAAVVHAAVEALEREMGTEGDATP